MVIGQIVILTEAYGEQFFDGIDFWGASMSFELLAYAVIKLAITDARINVYQKNSKYYSVSINRKIKEITSTKYNNAIYKRDNALYFLSNKDRLSFYTDLIGIDADYLQRKLKGGE
jgi:hypothetical protein